MHNHINALFQEPTAAYRGKPFWSWNGELNKEELLRQIHVLKDMGFGGFFMHSRTGLITEYMGEEWFDLINACADEAEKLGMEAWLYDEDRWPSGTAGGIVTEEPAYRLKYLRLRVLPPEAGFSWEDHESVVAVFVCKLSGLDYSRCRQVGHGLDPEAGPDESLLVFAVEEQARESFYNGFTYLDTLNREAVDHFLALTHEKYKSRSGGRFGKSIKGIFTDEPHRGALMDGFGAKNPDHEWLVPWTYTLFERFLDKYGYDLIPLLPELFLRPEGRKISRVKWHYTDLLQDMFHDNFAKPINEWCERNDLILTGHTLHEDSLSAQTAMVGSVMRFYEHMGYPGVDVLSEGNVNYWIVKQLASAARQLGKPWMMSELYGCTGWQMPLEGHKAVGDWQALFGINLRCHHLSWYTMEGESKRDFPASISYQSAWWQDYEKVETYFSRLGVLLSQGTPVCDLLVINPVESLWCQIYPGWSRGLSAQSPDVREIEQHYEQTFHWLAGGQLDFDYGDEEMMSRLSQIGKDPLTGAPVLHVGQASYRAVLVTGLTTMRSTTLSLLEKFTQAGGVVIMAGEAPAYIDAMPSEEGSFIGKAVPFERESLIEACRQAVLPPLELAIAQTGEPVTDIFAQVRTDGGRLCAVLMNMNRKDWHRGVEVRIRADAFAALEADSAGPIETWLCATGEQKQIAARLVDGIYSFTLDFPPVGEHVIVAGGGANHAGSDALTGSVPEVKAVAVRYEEAEAAGIEGSFDYRLEEPNVCVLDRVLYQLDGGPAAGPFEILKADREIRSQLGLPWRSGEMIQPWYRRKYLGESLHELARLRLAYTFNVEASFRGELTLAVERPDLFGIRLNGQPVAVPEEAGWWVDPCFVKIPLPVQLLQGGENVVELEGGFHAGIDLEAVYLLGAFGVKLQGTARILTALPESLTVGDITKQGLPFYGGAITYILRQEQAAAAACKLPAGDALPAGGSRTVLQFPAFEAACIRVRKGGAPEELLAWQPYEAELAGSGAQALEFDLVLTRRNTFGPLHQLPLLTPHYGPGNWVTEGESFDEMDVLLPSGLLAAPRIVRQHRI
ncbi:glycosyl hydrolase [Paenibacillus nasutitermitis]|uniref:Alpha-L-rhamnosidase n=1 Tax=Paenibacillus nasutitermitis TaxID=1652958 RepID=A0A916ZHY2_9BACL|nr:glycosyl hydrolase [Paenibacillus nasutitermitis]GGD98153.1 hypothetical protein GCM10010911_66200 [Paenibacillus nasutitermitis]